MLSQMHVCRYLPRWVLHVHVAKTTSTFSRTAHLAILHRHRPTTSSSSQQHGITCTKPAPRHQVVRLRYATSQYTSSSTSTKSDLNMHHPHGMRCNLHRLLRCDMASTLGRRGGTPSSDASSSTRRCYANADTSSPRSSSTWSSSSSSSSSSTHRRHLNHKMDT